ncbi:hypothetical protein ACWDBO_30270 [Streptomyces mirabilis]|uniref:hypothetical protein n=1 Tax=Streptomyces mirabilis TaxID=68239 RepID=UPI00331BA276
MRAVRIAPDSALTELVLPESDAHSAIRENVGSPGAVDQAAYHPGALLHIHGEGRLLGLGENLASWALASAWRGMPLYPLHGPVVVTGRAHHGGVAALDDDLVQHARTVTQTVRGTLDTWCTRPPVSYEAALRELLVYAARDVAVGR